MDKRTHPNVVFIVGDNVGWGDIACYGGLAPTPWRGNSRRVGSDLVFQHFTNVELKIRPHDG